MTLTATTPPCTAPNDWPTLRALPGDTSQQVFRACLTALARPGMVTRLPAGCVPDSVRRSLHPCSPSPT